MYQKTLVAGWGDMDFNAHMRNTAYLDKSADVRMMYFAAHGFPMSQFARLQLGPVVMRDQIDYFPGSACSSPSPWPWPGCRKTPAA